jgi:ribonuclease-3
LSDLTEFEERIGYTFANRDLLTRALTHKSFSHEAKNGGVQHNETFEFLGDSVLGFVVGDLLFSHFPTLDEGALSKMKAFLVSASSLGAKARHYGMGEVIFLGIGELIIRAFASDIKAIDEQDLLFHDYKTALQELAQGRGMPLPEYTVVGELGPDHDKTFVVEVKVGKLASRGEGSSKKEAQQQAAKNALELAR